MAEPSPDPQYEQRPDPQPGRLGWPIGGGRSDGQPRVRLELPISEIVRATVVVLVVWNVAGLLQRVEEVLLLLLLAVLLATAIGPAVDRLRRGPFTHGMGVLTVYSLIVLAIGVPIYAFFPYLASQASSFIESLPDRLLSLRSYAQALQPPPLADAAVGAVERASNAVRSPAVPPEEQLVQAGASAAQALFGFVTVFVLAFYWLVERVAIKHALMRILPPRHAEDLDVMWREVEVRIGGWVRGQAVLMGAIGLMAGVGYAVIGLPNAALLGVFAGLVEIVPLVGPFLAFAPAVLVGLAIDPAKALITVAYAAIIQQFEANILVPRVMGQAVGISQLTVLLGILVGSILYGLPGTFIAVPIAAALQVIVGHYIHGEAADETEARGVGQT